MNTIEKALMGKIRKGGQVLNYKFLGLERS